MRIPLPKVAIATGLVLFAVATVLGLAQCGNVDFHIYGPLGWRSWLTCAAVGLIIMGQIALTMRRRHRATPRGASNPPTAANHRVRLRWTMRALL